MPFPGFRKKDPYLVQEDGLQAQWGQYQIHPIVPCMWKDYFPCGKGLMILVLPFQTKRQLETFQSLHKKVQESFVNEKPPHLLGNDTSLHILTEHVWVEMSSTQVQEILKTGAITIKNSTTNPLFSFDCELFSDMLGHGDMGYVVLMEDQSLGQVIPVEMQSLLSSHEEGDDGKSLLAHHFLGDSVCWLESTACSSRIAWQATKGHEMCKDLFTHQNWASWCGAAMKGVLMMFPMDPDGLFLHLRLWSGMGYIILEDTSPLARRHEGLVLGPNARLYEPIYSSAIRSMILSNPEAVFMTRAKLWSRVFWMMSRVKGTEGAQLTATEEGHIPSLDTIHGITDIFVLISTTLLLNVIDYRQYVDTSAPPSVCEEEEIRLAQWEAWILVVFLGQTINIVKEGTTEPVLVEKALFFYLRLQGRQLLWELRMVSHAQQDEVLCRSSAADFLQDDHACGIFQEAWKEETEEAPGFFTPLDQALGIVLCVLQDNNKCKSTLHSKRKPK
ncbi:hypothetical protein L208DRAFT_1382035 [Tricholoma matsutake]|nr:hypothetical protein L208DRAFT_1382035 [Tricholoma matsutake 945]